MSHSEPRIFAFLLSIAKGYIDLSKRRVSPEDITKCEERYMKSKTVAGILRHVASRITSVDGEGEPDVAPPKDIEAEADADAEVVEAEVESPEPKSRRTGKREAGAGMGGPGEEERLEKLYEAIAWPLGKTFGHPYDAFKLALR